METKIVMIKGINQLVLLLCLRWHKCGMEKYVIYKLAFIWDFLQIIWHKKETANLIISDYMFWKQIDQVLYTCKKEHSEQ